MATYDLGKVVGDAGEKGDDGSTVWNTSTAPTYANSKYTFNISNLSGKTGLTIAVNDIIFYSTYYYIVSTVNTTTVDCSTRVSIKGSDASVTIVDNLTSTSSTSALSAKQGKVLNDNKIETSSIATSFGSTLSDTKVPSEKLTKNSLDAKADASSLATVATTGDYDDLTDKPTIPSASTTTPSADTSSGSYGSGTSYARSNHTHPKSSLYAEATHSHTKSQITDFPSIPSKTSDLTNDGADGTNVFVANNDSRLSDSRTPTSHRASATTYGVGNASYYGHCRVINNLTKSSHTDGYALSAYQGYILKQDVDGKASSTHNHTKSDITDFPTLHTVATSGSYNDLLDKPNIPSGVVVDLNLDGTSNNAVANSAVVGGLNDKIEASDISFGFDADTKEIYIEVN